jgi:chlorite dismutase
MKAQEVGLKAQPKAAQRKKGRRQVMTFTFYQVDPAWRRLEEKERERGKAEFLQVLLEYTKGLVIKSYSLIGLRGDCDFLLWRIGEDMETLQEMSAKLFKTGLGKYLTVSHSYLAMAKASQYEDKVNPEHSKERERLTPSDMRYIFVYPFTKQRAWYALSHKERQRIMDEHIAVGSRFPSVKLNTSYSFGLDDQEFMLAFESDHPGDFLDLVMELRGSESSRFTEQDTPIFTGIARSFEETLDLLG